MTKVARLVVILSVPLILAGCGTEADDSSGSDASGQKPTCELESKTELADANEVAPNGRSGAEILAAVPESLHTSLHWDFSTSDIEVEVPGAIGLSTGLDLSFSFPAEPQFFFEDRIVVEPSGESVADVEVICEDYVTTTVDVTLVTEDGTIALDLPGLTVRLGPDDPATGHVAKPLLYQTAAMESFEVSFLQPEALAASGDKTITMVIDGEAVEGSLIVHAEGASTSYEHLVARW